MSIVLPKHIKIACPNCKSEDTKILAEKGDSSTKIILCRCNECRNQWERWKPLFADYELDL